MRYWCEIMSKPETKNELAWQELFEKYDIINEIDKIGFYEISANQIKEFREPRLMTKFDHRESLPNQFKNNKLSVLPLTRE